ncbi:uncharacterized protein LOC119721240 isoform X2 [Patiria miniata]|uniref:PNT domain-containing protein n=1 Tax=Patiria miniata TaxID=46514 RepID=A0A913Z5R5_PATMI|nr:uncharacterized protein LOC119721240 isoform X2 [Patiria miniata]
MSAEVGVMSAPLQPPGESDFKVNKWLALKRRTASLPVVCSPTASSGGLSSDANGNCKVKRFRHQDRVTDPLQLPIDPRSWSTNDVRTWLGHMTKSHDLEVDPSFFQMNGRGLCLMPLKGFLFRVPDHGKLLYEDFRGRLRQCLLAPGNDTRPKTEQGAGTKSSREAASPSGPARKHRRAVVSYQGVVVVGKSSVTDCKGQMSPTTYHTL